MLLLDRFPSEINLTNCFLLRSLLAMNFLVLITISFAIFWTVYKSFNSLKKVLVFLTDDFLIHQFKHRLSEINKKPTLMMSFVQVVKVINWCSRSGTIFVFTKRQSRSNWRFSQTWKLVEHFTSYLLLCWPFGKRVH